MRYSKDGIPLVDGQRVTCTIYGQDIFDAKIAIYKNRAFVCQNMRGGLTMPAEAKHGYQYSWVITDKGWHTFYEGDYNVTNFNIVVNNDGYEIF
jgi:hypothetical protein